MPEGAKTPASDVVEDRADIDRALFAVLAGWARERLDAKDDAEFDRAAGYVRRCELLPGLSEDQRQELKALRAGIAFRRGKRLVEGVAAQLRQALEELKLAKGLGGAQVREIDAWIFNVETKLRDFEAPIAATAAPPAEAPPMAETPEAPPAAPAATDDEPTQPPKWRL
jgi:hypothetical protein